MVAAVSVGQFPTIGEQIVSVGGRLHQAQYEIVTLAAAMHESDEWLLEANTAAHWIADALDTAVSTAREWIRIGRALIDLHQLDEGFRTGRLSYSKVRAVSRVATPANELDLVELAERTPANRLGVELAAYLKSTEPDDVRDARLHEARSLTFRTDADGMVHGTFRLPPLLAAILLAVLDALVLRQSRRAPKPVTERARNASADASNVETWPSLAQQRADALVELARAVEAAGCNAETSPVNAEIVVHVRGDGATLDDGTPLTDAAVERIAPRAFIRALIHNAEGKPVNASGRQRHPTARQRRVVKERDRCCVDCGSSDLLEFDHVPDYAISGRTLVEELVLRCAPCHRRRHRSG